MDISIREKIASIVEMKQTKTDPSHDFQHILRVVYLAEKIGKKEKADTDVLIAAAFLHDIVVYKKNSSRNKYAADESAHAAGNILKKVIGFPKEKIPDVTTCIKECSFSKGIMPKLLESKILQDADMLEATGAIAIMRTFSSCGNMNIRFYDPADPLCEKRVTHLRSGIDLFFNRLLVVESRMHTDFAKRLSKKRTRFVKLFLREFRRELGEANLL